MINEISKYYPLAWSFLSAVALWIGLISLGRKTKGTSWFGMMIGVVVYSISILLQIWGKVEQAFAPSSWFALSDGARLRWQIIGITSHFMWINGIILFSIGFAFYGHRILRLHNRITELEMMNLAQATELERLRNR